MYHVFKWNNRMIWNNLQLLSLDHTERVWLQWVWGLEALPGLPVAPKQTGRKPPNTNCPCMYRLTASLAYHTCAAATWTSFWMITTSHVTNTKHSFIFALYENQLEESWHFFLLNFVVFKTGYNNKSELKYIYCTIYAHKSSNCLLILRSWFVSINKFEFDIVRHLL